MQHTKHITYTELHRIDIYNSATFNAGGFE